MVGRVRLRTILIIRWIAVAGQALTLLVVHYVLGFPMQIGWAGTTVAALAAVTLATQVRRPQSERLTDRESAFYFAFDILQLAVLLYLTGGLNNPFSVLILAPVTVSAAALSYRSTLGLAGARDRLRGAARHPARAPAVARGRFRRSRHLRRRLCHRADPRGHVPHLLCLSRGAGIAAPVGRAVGGAGGARPRAARLVARRTGGGGGARAGLAARHHLAGRQGAGARPAEGVGRIAPMPICW